MKRKREIKEILLMENKIFTIIHAIALILILLIIIFISILKYTMDEINADEQKNFLEDIQTEEDSDTDTTISTPYNNEEVLLNPGKGMVYRKTKNDAKYNDIISVGYTRFNWSDIEVEEGIYNWDKIDQVIDEYAKSNKKFAFGVMNVNSASNKTYITPKFIFDAGAKGTSQDLTFWENNKQVTQIIPDWKDEIYLSKLNNFIKALAKRYDGNENIAYIDIRSYGNWGEQHLGGLTTKQDITADELKELYIKPYKEAFTKTLLVNPWGKAEYNETYKWAIDNGISIRRDGIFQHSNGSECAMAYGKLPTIFEYTSNYNWMKQNNYWSQENLLKYVETGKPSYLQFDEAMYKENKNFIKMIANKIGYYFKFKGAEYKNKVTTREENEIKLNFINEGVAPLYEPCTVYIGLLDKKYNLVKKYKTDIDPHRWNPGEEIQEDIKLKLDGVQDGEYIISLGLFLNEDDLKPAYLLGNTGGTNDKWYVFGKINITNVKEEYNINVENEQYLVNTINGYKININAKNLLETSKYSAKIYNNNNLIQTINIESNKEEYNKQINLSFADGNNTYKIEIQKDGNTVYQTSKEIYVINFMEDKESIITQITRGYAEFRSSFMQEISAIPEIANRIAQLESNIANVSTQNEAKQVMEEHYEIGSLIIQACKTKNINLDYSRLNQILDMLNNIGNLYENLVTISKKNVNDEETANSKIQEAQAFINNNQDLEMLYPSRILNLSKECYEKAEYINNLQESNIKAGLIISKNLHANLLADWATNFTQLCIEDYITNNPVKIVYSKLEPTNEDVKATVTTNAKIQITNNNNSTEYVFKENGTYKFEYTIRGQAHSIEAQVSNIDKNIPVITGVKEGKTYTSKRNINVTDENLLEVKLILNDEEKEYQSNMEVTEEGIYTIIAKDKAGNKTEINFQIMLNSQEGYQIEGNIIKNIPNNTKLTEFEEKFNTKVSYKILRNDKELKDDTTIATGDILKMQNGDEYTLIVTGDLNKDGDVNVKDMIKMRKYLLDGNNLDDIEKIAADCNLDGDAISIKDFIRMRIIILNKKV